MRAFVILISFFFCWFIKCYSQSWPVSGSIDYAVGGNIPSIKQPKSMDCWITVATMMLSWRMDTSYTVNQVADKIGAPWNVYFLTNRGLYANEQSDFLRTMGFTSEGPANYTIEGYMDLLKTYGPIWITSSDGFSAHARLLIAIRGDGTYEGTYLQFIDPLTGNLFVQDALTFSLNYEKEARYVMKERYKAERKILKKKRKKWKNADDDELKDEAFYEEMAKALDLRPQVIHWP